MNPNKKNSTTIICLSIFLKGLGEVGPSRTPQSTFPQPLPLPMNLNIYLNTSPLVNHRDQHFKVSSAAFLLSLSCSQIKLMWIKHTSWIYIHGYRITIKTIAVIQYYQTNSLEKKDNSKSFIRTGFIFNFKFSFYFFIRYILHEQYSFTILLISFVT